MQKIIPANTKNKPSNVFVLNKQSNTEEKDEK